MIAAPASIFAQPRPKEIRRSFQIMSAPRDQARTLTDFSQHPPQHNILTGVGWMLVSVLIYGTMNAVSKSLLIEIPVLELVFFRSLFALVPLIPGIRAEGYRAFVSHRPRLQAVRAISGFAALVCFFFAIGHLPLADAVTLGFADAFWINGLSGPLLGEWARGRDWGLVALGFCGVLVILRPGFDVIQPAALAAIGGSLCYAISMITVRKLSTIDTRTVTVLSFTGFSLLMSGATLPWIWVTPTAGAWPVLVAVGLLGGLAQIALIRGFSLAPPPLVAPLGYLSLPLGAFLGYFMWQEIPRPHFFLGALMIIGAGTGLVVQKPLPQPGKPSD